MEAVFSPYVTVAIPEQCMLMCSMIDTLYMLRDADKNEVIKKLLSSQWQNMGLLSCNADEWNRICTKHFLYKAQNEWDFYYKDAENSDERNLCKAIKHCTKALQHAWKVYLEKSTMVLRFVFLVCA